MLAAAAAEPAHFEVRPAEIEIDGLAVITKDADRLAHEVGMAAGHGARLPSSWPLA
jgi:hypothetical protein